MVKLVEVAIDVASNYAKNKTKDNSKPMKPSKQKNKKSNNNEPVKNNKEENPMNRPVTGEVRKPSPVTDAQNIELIPQISPENLLQGIIWSEILGKPVSKRRGRW
jgi:hypothetical protein